MAVQIRFSRLPRTNQPVRLVFGEAEDTPGGGTDVLDGVGVLPGLQVFGRMTWDSRTERPIGRGTGVKFQQAHAAGDEHSVRFQQAVHLGAPNSIRWRDARPLARTVRTRFQNDRRLDKRIGVHYEDALHLYGGRALGRFQDNLRHNSPRTASRYQEAIHMPGRGRSVRYQDALQLDAPTRQRYQDALHLATVLEAHFNNARRVDRPAWSRFQDAAQPRIGTYVPPEMHDPCYTPPSGGAVQLRFHTPRGGNTQLRFVCERHGTDPELPPATVTIPVRKVYVVINEASLTRVDGNVPIRNTQFSLAIDVDSWTWAFSARVPSYHLGDLQPGTFGDRTVLEAMVNGTSYRVIVEQITRERTFSGNWLTVSGRGLNAVLDGPYAPTRDFTVPIGGLSAAQLLDHVLTDNGVSLGWAVDWGLSEDWLVPAGAWTHQGTYMSAVNQIAAAAGGYVQPHPVDTSLFVLPRYPSLPWAWDSVTPDFSLPAALAQREGTEWMERPAYNQVFVSGEGAGVLARIKRSGTAGDILAPLVVDPLISAGAPARMRGESVLANTGRQARITLRTPVLPSAGLIHPGKFVRYHDGSDVRIGLTRSVSVDVSMPNIWQTVVLETHL